MQAADPESDPHCYLVRVRVCVYLVSVRAPLVTPALEHLTPPDLASLPPSHSMSSTTLTPSTSASPFPANVNLVGHPLLAHHLSLLRLESTHAKDFRSLLDSITSILVTEATRNLPTTRVTGKAPLCQFEGDEMAVSWALLTLQVQSRGRQD